MTFAYRVCLYSIAIGVSASSPVWATAPKLDTETCSQLRLEHMKYVASGAAADLLRGPAWGKANLSADKLRDIELFIQLEEQINFGCRDAKLTMDAERAAEAAKRLEMNPDLDPTLPPPADSQGTGDSDGTVDAPAGAASSGEAKPKPKHKAGRKHKSDDAFKADANSGDAAAPAVSAPANAKP